jgi:uncharacterized protein (DUF305 family)
VKALARRIREGQEREAREMRAMAPKTAREPNATGTSGQDHHGQMMAESKKAVERVRAATGTQADIAFLDEMARHHEMAIEMTKETRFDSPMLKRMAEKMTANQTRELDELKRARARVS